jgi:hypothetical protein
MYKDMAAYFTGLEPCVESLAKNREYYAQVKEGTATMEEVVTRAEAECAAAEAAAADGAGEPAPAVESDDDIDGDDV